MKENRNIAKVNKTRGWLFANINKIDSTSARLTKKKKIQIITIRNESTDITTKAAEIQMVIRIL